MNPYIFTFGDRTFQPYSTMMIIGLIFALIWGYYDANKQGLRKLGFDGRELIGGIFTFILGAVGARFVYLLLNWNNFMAEPYLIFLPRLAGFSFYGGVLGAIIGSYLWCRWRKLNYFVLLDHFILYWGAGFLFARGGCFLAGCCYGKVTDLPWGVIMQSVDMLPRHPSQLYEILGGLAGIYVLFLRKNKPFNGFIILVVLAHYGVVRFVVEFFREGVPYWLWLTNAQIASLGLLFVSLSAIVIIHKIIRNKKIKGFID